jgi:hypothetical protein
LSFQVPLSAGRGARGEGVKYGKKAREGYVFAKPSPNPLPKGEGRENEK